MPKAQTRSNPAGPLQQAVALHQQGRLPEAERLLTQVLRRFPGSPDALQLLGVIALQTGRLERGLALLQSAIRAAPHAAALHSNSGIALRRLGRLDEALASYEKAIALDPDCAEAHYNRADVLRALKRPEDALASYDAALALRPGDAETHCGRGIALRTLGRADEAVASYDRALALNPDHAEAHFNRGNALGDLNRFEDALASYDTAIALRPQFADAYHNRGTALRHLKRPDDAIADHDTAIALRPNSPDPPFSKALDLLTAGRFAEGWPQYEWRKKLPEPIAAGAYRQPLWTGAEDVRGKTVFLWWEQGLGDTLQFCRYGRLLRARGARVVMAVQDPLVRLLRQLEPDVMIIGGDRAPAEFDYHCPLLSLPLAFGTTLETIPSPTPYLQADPRLTAEWDSRLPRRGRMRVGVVWNGHPSHKNDRNRSLEIGQIAPLLATDAHWICLHKERRRSDAAASNGPEQPAFFGDQLTDFAETAALIQNLDLVVTVDTSVAHLAGALGKPVWILLPYNSDWRWLLEREDSPWYVSARLFRQPAPNDWPSVIQRVTGELSAFARTV